MATYLHEFVIDEKKWYHGSDVAAAKDSRLMVDKNNFCCLGLFGKSCGLKNSDIKGIPAPEEVLPGSKRAELFNKICLDKNGFDKKTTKELMGVNDKEGPHSERKKRVKQLFRKLRVKVSFKNET